MCDVHNEVAFVVVRPRKWYDVVVELKEGPPVKFIETAGLEEMQSDVKRLRWLEPINPASLNGEKLIGL
jgi:hypothetical protein